MLSKKLFRWMHTIAFFAIVFASLAPSISHAMAAKSGTNSFTQEICNSQGKKISIQVTTTKGQQITAEFAVKQSPQPKSITMHFEHCPFCGGNTVTTALPSNKLEMIALLEITAKKAAEYAVPALVSRTYESPPSQAPPQIL